VVLVLKIGPFFPLKAGGPGASEGNNGYRAVGTTRIKLGVHNGEDNNSETDYVRMLFLAEYLEILMSYNHQQGNDAWKAPTRDFEGVSKLVKFYSV